MKNRMTLLLTGAALIQLLVLTGMVGVSAMPLWTGTEVKVKTRPVDPRSLFRGNYARMGYEFDRIEFDRGEQTEPKKGDVIYVILNPAAENGLYDYSSWTAVKPASGTFLRGRVKSVYCNSSCRLSAKFGIEAFFAPKEKAIALERNLRADDAVAVLMVSRGGRARLKSITFPVD